LTEGGEERICGFALHFADGVWQVILKDCEDNYYFITVKDPNGVGRSIEAVAEFISGIYAGDGARYSSALDSAAMQNARNRFTEYAAEHAGDEGIYGCFVFTDGNSRFVSVRGGTVLGVYYSLDTALRAFSGNADTGKLSATDFDDLWKYGGTAE